MEIVETLNKTLLNGKPDPDKECLLDINAYKQMALMYSRIENAISVLSDMQADKSYVYSSGAALALGLDFRELPVEIDSIWEEDILKKIHPDDKLKKYIHELRFFKLLESANFAQYPEYSVLSRLRMKDKNARYRPVQHRMFYVYSPFNKKLRFALCLYNLAIDEPLHRASEFLIVNSVTGEVIEDDKLNYRNILSKREMEILRLVGEGHTSKEIADLLSISINTVSRHRQNILEKLNVKNSITAFNSGILK